jgi:hypothetical protein
VATTTIERRVARLEESAGVGGGWDGPPCEECGWNGPDDDSEADTFELVFDERPYDEPDEEETCRTCGRVLSMTIYFEDMRQLLGSL